MASGGHEQCKSVCRLSWRSEVEHWINKTNVNLNERKQTQMVNVVNDVRLIHSHRIKTRPITTRHRSANVVLVISDSEQTIHLIPHYFSSIFLYIQTVYV
jgi:hypothetical protein